ncbi:hypothetical protein TSUD_321160 [Trifolium subterraneum]|uniref:Reverse transcriptase domain-containing protein n=1 Tax=Trifolium subterraneum TaxID=3900 RepID=A0A2Z6ND56_TRISU|nr:hypothetical protein TSUD_321160 [Trifolium subterraneum]
MGFKFTWRGPVYHGGQRIYERLDRALCNSNWRLMFPDGFVKVLTRVEYSDHHPILISTKAAPHLVAPRQFHFESAWFLEPYYTGMLQQNWNNNVSITNNLVSIEKAIKEWKFHTIDQVLHQKKHLLARIGGVQHSLQRGLNRGGMRRLEKRLQDELSSIIRKEELMWYQRSRAKWLKDGDRNTKYYHLKTINRKRRNNVNMLKNDSGQWVDDVFQIRNLATDFYRRLFADNQISRAWHNTSITYPVLDTVVMNQLAAPICEGEVKKAVFSMHPWKAPGPDGFSAGFYQKSWDIVGKTIYNFVENVWHNPSAIAEVNQTDICLIPKVDKPEFVTQFRPISLCNTNYKIVSKVIVERLKECVASLVSPYQTGFVPGRNIHENIVAAKEMAHTMNYMKGRNGAFAVKVDLSKAYDKLSWEFIWKVLVEIKFSEPLINIIMHSISSVMTNVKWNDTRTDFFRPQRGIRQGDPISPYLFVLCMDKLSHIILQAVEEGKWRGIKAGRNGPMISHLMFADDLLLFGSASVDQMRCVVDSLNLFCSMSGQEVSQDKTSVMFSRNVERSLRTKLLSITGYKETSNFGKYLGVPLHGRALKKADFQYLLDQASMKLSLWKANHLSFAGRVTLAKSVIEAIPNYPMMSSLIPKACLDEIQRIQRNFIWGDTEQKRKYHAIGWEKIVVTKDMGGLGMRKLDIMNKTCLCKLGWKLQAGGDALWCSVLRGKYCRDNSLLPRPYDGIVLEKIVDIPQRLHGVKLCDLVDSMGRWKCNLMVDWLPAIIIKKIVATLPPSEEHGNDERVIAGGTSSQFSVAGIWQGRGSWSDVWALSCHCLWSWRNKEMYEVNFSRPSRPPQHVLKLAEEYFDAVSNNAIVTVSNTSVSEIGWIPPRDLFVRLNTDGAYKEHVVAGCGGLIRGSQGEWLGGFAKCVGLCSAFVAELWGVLERLRFVYRLGFRRVELHTDFVAVAQVLQKGSSLSTNGGALLKQIWQLLELDWVVVVSYTYREANKCADALANLGCTLDCKVEFYDACPAIVRDVYQYDLIGNTTPRLISM